MDQLPRLGKRELICLLLFTCNYVVSVWRGFLFFWVLGMGYVILLWHSLSLPYNYFVFIEVFCYCAYDWFCVHRDTKLKSEFFTNVLNTAVLKHITSIRFLEIIFILYK